MLNTLNKVLFSCEYINIMFKLPLQSVSMTKQLDSAAKFWSLGKHLNPEHRADWLKDLMHS